MKFLTDFGDSAVLLPLSALILIWLLAARPFVAALWWGFSLAFLAIVMGALKILFFACPPVAELSSPSGHTGFSLIVYGGLAIIVAALGRSFWQRAAVIGLAILLVLGIARSRVALEMHTPLETVVGFIVGAMALAIFGFGYFRAATGKRQVLLLMIGVAVTVAVFHGSQLNPEPGLHSLSGWLGLRRLFCPR